MSLYEIKTGRRFIGLEADKPATGDLHEGETFYATDSDIAYIADENKVLKPTVRPYKVYTALLSQAGVAVPSEVVLEKTFGALVLARTGIGTYTITSSAEFTAAKVSLQIGDPKATITRTSDSIITITTSATVGGAAADDLLINTFVEIRVYL